MIRLHLCAILLLAVAASANAQQSADVGKVVESSAGEVGQRQTKADFAAFASSLKRVENRIQNRVQSRIGNRIDRFYNPQLNAASSFTSAEQRQRDVDRRGPR